MVAERPKLRRASRRLDPTSATRLGLALALAIVIGGGLLLAALAFLIRSQNGLARVDQSVAAWGQQHASALTDNVLTAITFVGQPSRSECSPPGSRSWRRSEHATAGSSRSCS